jgi:hypothetical protein
MVWWAQNLKPNKMLADHFGIKLRNSSQTVVCVLRSVTVSSLNQEVSVLQNHHFKLLHIDDRKTLTFVILKRNKL